MKKIISLCMFSILICMNSSGQILDKLNENLNKAERAKGTLDKVKGWLSKKKKTPETATNLTLPKDTVKARAVDSVATGSKNTQISISGIDFSTLKRLNENIQACSGVQSAKIKYNSATSTIDVVHTGTTDELLKLMEETSKDIFTEKQIESFEEGKISLKLK